MSDGFARAAATLAGIIPAITGWNPDQFWKATPLEIGAILYAMQQDETADPVSKDQLEKLKEQHPDAR